jgi:hypothetical protein
MTVPPGVPAICDAGGVADCVEAVVSGVGLVAGLQETKMKTEVIVMQKIPRRNNAFIQ